MNRKIHWIVILLALLAITGFVNATEVNMTEFELTDTEWRVEE